MSVFFRGFDGEKRDFLTSPPEFFIRALTGGLADSGVTVNATTALGSTPVWAAIKVISEDIASLPLITYRRIEKGKERAINNPIFPLLHDEPNPHMTACEFWELAVGNVLINGNSVNFIAVDGSGRVVELWPLRPDQIQLELTGDGDLLYHWIPSGSESRTFVEDEILHIRSFSRNGLWGLSPIDVARQAIGLNIAAEEYGARFFSNNATAGGVLEHPGPMGETAVKNLRESLQEFHTGLSTAHKTLILEEGMKWHQTTISPDNAQFLETRKFQVTEIARIFRIAPHKIADLERATFSNIEEQAIDHVVSTIRPWARRIEQRINATLFKGPMRRRFFVEFLIDALLRGNIQTRFEAHAKSIQWSWATINEVREKENMNPIEGGDVRLQPLNMIAVGPDAPPIPPTPPSPFPPRQVPDETTPAVRANLKLLEEERSHLLLLDPGLELRSAARQKLRTAFLPVFDDVAQRIIRREIHDVERKAEKHLERDIDSLKSSLEDFYLDDHRSFVELQIRPAIESLAGAVHDSAVDEINGAGFDGLAALIAGVVFGISDRWVRWSNAQLDHVLSDPETDAVEALRKRLAEWQERRAGKFAKRETVNVESAVARKTWQANGVTRLRWVATKPLCPMCDELNGRIVGIESHFVDIGEELVGTDGRTRIRTQGKTRHPPLHGGCDCVIVPE